MRPYSLPLNALLLSAVSALLELGIWPFHEDGLLRADVRNGNEPARRVRTVTPSVLGYHI